MLFSLQYLDDNLLFFDEESTDDSGSDSSATEGTTVGTGNGLLAFGVLSQLAWTTGFDTTENVSSVTAYWSFGLKIFIKTMIRMNNCTLIIVVKIKSITKNLKIAEKAFIRIIYLNMIEKSSNVVTHGRMFLRKKEISIVIVTNK